MTLSRLSSVRSLSPRSYPLDQLVHDRFYPPNQPEPNLSSLSLSLSFSRGFEEDCDGSTATSCRVEEKSDRDAQFTLPRSRCWTNELTSAIHRIDRNGCARNRCDNDPARSCIDIEDDRGIGNKKDWREDSSIRFVFDVNVYYPP